MRIYEDSITVVVVYAPSGDENETTKQEFFDTIEELQLKIDDSSDLKWMSKKESGSRNQSM